MCYLQKKKKIFPVLYRLFHFPLWEQGRGEGVRVVSMYTVALSGHDMAVMYRRNYLVMTGVRQDLSVCQL